jgi:serine/threonine protein kinase
MRIFVAGNETMVTSPEQLRRAKELFEAGCAQEGSARTAVLDNGCHGDLELRFTVERMIEASCETHPILDHPLALQKEKLMFGGEALEQGAKVGSYEVIRELGSGGMGTVYLAKSSLTGNEKLFAIKVIRSRSQEVSRRFQQEQAILKNLQHPNIARLIDSGATPDGDPYFVMEYVEGQRLDLYCEAKSLSAKSRIGLFRQLCAAVQYLHQNLVVHRDLKPSNILVKTDGTIKLVDFGIAKLLQISDEFLVPLNATIGLMTPDYASPEQICGGPLSTLTDVYSLGIVLYELLTGTKPFSASDSPLHETIRRICEEEPSRPSTAILRNGTNQRQAGELRGELDNIVLKALRKEPERRYVSVEQFDEDLRRYMHALPVLAQGDSLPYRAKKFFRRYKAAVTVTLIILFLLIGGIVAASFEARIARTERQKAELHAQEVEQEKALAERQTKVAEQERLHANRAADEARIQKGNAERRLRELQQLANAAVQVYSTTHERLGPADADVIAQNAHDSLAVLQQETPLGPDFARMFATTAPSRSNSDDAWRVPFGWKARETVPHEYFVGVDHKIIHHGRSSLFVHSVVKKSLGTLYVAQVFDAKQFRGKRVMLSGYLKSKNVRQQMRLSLVAAKEGQNGSFDGVTLSGTELWRRYQIVIDVPSNADAITIGFYLDGTGSFWADQLGFKQVDSRTPLTIPLGPHNLSFH